MGVNENTHSEKETQNIVDELFGIASNLDMTLDDIRNERLLRPEQSTARLFEEIYGKPFADITLADLGCVEIINWGEDVGGEVIASYREDEGIHE